MRVVRASLAALNSGRPPISDAVEETSAVAHSADPHRVAAEHLRRARAPDPGNDPADLNFQVDLMMRLMDKGEARRLGRTSDIRVLRTWYDGDRVTANVMGTKDLYETRITIRPRPGHHCECPDWAQNGMRVGPCKHVLKLAEEWWQVLVAKLEGF